MSHLPTGIAVIGLNGSGKSTITHATASATGWFEMDVEDYYFPAHRETRQRVLNGQPVPPSRDNPYDKAQSKAQVESALLADILNHPNFILSGVHLHWSAEILSHIRLVFWVQTPKEVRLARIQERELRRFGDRVLPGGDMYESQRAFHEMVSARREDEVADSIAGKQVILLDGLAPVAENVRRMREMILW